MQVVRHSAMISVRRSGESLYQVTFRQGIVAEWMGKGTEGKSSGEARVLLARFNSRGGAPRVEHRPVSHECGPVSSSGALFFVGQTCQSYMEDVSRQLQIPTQRLATQSSLDLRLGRKLNICLEEKEDIV